MSILILTAFTTYTYKVQCNTIHYLSHVQRVRSARHKDAQIYQSDLDVQIRGPGLCLFDQSAAARCASFGEVRPYYLFQGGS